MLRCMCVLGCGAPALVSHSTFCCSGQMVQERSFEASQAKAATATFPGRAGELRASHRRLWHRRYAGILSHGLLVC